MERFLTHEHSCFLSNLEITTGQLLKGLDFFFLDLSFPTMRNVRRRPVLSVMSVNPAACPWVNLEPERAL